MPRQASGRLMRKNTAAEFDPKVRAARSSCGSTSRNAARAARRISGNAAIAAAITAPCQVKMRLMPNAPCSQPPMTPLRPSTTSR